MLAPILISITTLLTAPVPGRFPQGSTTALSELALSRIFADDWGLLVNEVYARHGYPFQTAQQQAYFRRQPWYHPLPAPTPLTPLETANVQLVRRIQREGYSGFAPVLARVEAAIRAGRINSLRDLLAPQYRPENSPRWPTPAELTRSRRSLSFSPQGVVPAPTSLDQLETMWQLTTPGAEGTTWQFFFVKRFSARYPQGRWLLTSTLAPG